jgi:hypothetical protein
MFTAYLRQCVRHCVRHRANLVFGLATALVMAMTLAVSPSANAQSDDQAYRDGLDTLWQSLWGQGAVPTPVIRWVGHVNYHFASTTTPAQRQHILQGLAQATKLTGVEFTDATHLGKQHPDTRLVIEVVNPGQGSGLDVETPCFVEHQAVTSFRLQKVLLRMGRGAVQQCALHEIMHVMGIVGHPSGQTQLSYSPKQKATFTELDQLMLRAWYSDAARPGMNPFEMITLLTEKWMLLHLDQSNQAQTTRNTFLQQVFDDAIRYAEQSRAGNGRGLISQYVAYAFAHGVIANKDPIKAQRWAAQALTAD